MTIDRLGSAMRRRFLAAPLALVAARDVGSVEYPGVAGPPITFPRDHGSHPDFRTEWWYVTARVRDATGAQAGVQITFFRTRTGIGEESRSRFAPRQLLFGHAAIALPERGKLIVDQRAAREGFGLARASLSTTDVRIGDWSLSRDDRTYAARIPARDFTISLTFRELQPPLLQGDNGISRKGPSASQASRYYSAPQLETRGTLTVGGHSRDVTGAAWLDHEWSSEYLAADARGWDWTGLNLDDGGALMAFRIRDRAGATYWAGGALRDASGRQTAFAPADVAFTPVRMWRSPRTDLEYPVAMRVRAGTFDATLEPLFDDQELDARASVGTVYWEGAVAARADGRGIGRGYLELTGYGTPLRL
jgi:predicted secreted hydrolase